MMEVVIVDDGNRLTVYELVERVIPCIIAKHYSENYIQGFRSTFRNLLAYCNKNEKKYFTAELAQQFMLDCYGVQPGTVERRCSRVHRAMDLLSDYQHFNAVMLRRRLNRELGHINADSTQKYIGVNVRQLRSCALEVTD